MKKAAILLVSLVVVLSGNLFGSPVVPNATFGFAGSGPTSYTPGPPGGTLIGATSVTIPSVEFVNNLPCKYLGVLNDFSDGLTPCKATGITPLSQSFPSNTLLSFNSYVIDLSFAGTLPVISFSYLGDVLTFTASSGSKMTSIQGSDTFLNVSYFGTFHDTAGTYYLNGNGSVALSFEQTGASTGTVNYSGVFATPLTPDAPEPMSMLLMGSGLLMVGVVARKRARK